MGPLALLRRPARPHTSPYDLDTDDAKHVAPAPTKLLTSPYPTHHAPCDAPIKVAHRLSVAASTNPTRSLATPCARRAYEVPTHTLNFFKAGPDGLVVAFLVAAASFLRAWSLSSTISFAAEVSD